VAAKKGPRGYARAFYHFTDRRFTAWGKYSKKLVPRLAGRIAPYAEAAEGCAYLYLYYESLHSMVECSGRVKY
jgi:hypothetical protein